MLVDPNTGMPMGGGSQRENMIEAALSADSAGAGTISGFAQGMGVSRKGDILDKSLDTIPGFTQSTLWNVRRGFNTIAYGGRGIEQIGGVRATLSPRFLTRLPSAEALGGRSVVNEWHAFGAKKYAKGEAYTPFNSLYKAGNWGVRKAASTKTIARMAQDGGKFSSKLTALNEEGNAFSAGALARITAADKMARGALSTGNVANFIGKTDQQLLQSFHNVKIANSANQAKTMFLNKTGTGMPKVPPNFNPTAEEASRLTYASVDGAISGRISGFMSQTRLGTAGADAVKAAEASGNKAFVGGVKAAENFMAKGGFMRAEGKFVAKAGSELVTKFGVGVGERVGLGTAARVAMQKGGLKIGARIAAATAANAVPILGQVVSALLWADLAMDVGKLGVEVFKSGVDFAKEGVKSYRGQINKGVMGMGYRDNTVAATSRARGVQAIQNSRLNARSILGSEAGAMHAHFG